MILLEIDANLFYCIFICKLCCPIQGCILNNCKDLATVVCVTEQSHCCIWIWLKIISDYIFKFLQCEVHIKVA